jgi:prepilin-type N-terminal cleavage/methylation domain-containing protein
MTLRIEEKRTPMTRARSLLLRLTKKNNQKGFTLIELLVVISILGILAAVVTMSMVGITKIANDNAAKAELQTVQVAYDTMLSDRQVPDGSQCPDAVNFDKSGAAQSDMTKFPNSNTTSSALGLPIQLAPNYLHQPNGNMKHSYLCDTHGTIHQS